MKTGEIILQGFMLEEDYSSYEIEDYISSYKDAFKRLCFNKFDPFIAFDALGCYCNRGMELEAKYLILQGLQILKHR